MIPMDPYKLDEAINLPKDTLRQSKISKPAMHAHTSRKAKAKSLFSLSDSMSGTEGWKALSTLATEKKLPNEFVLAVAGAGSN